VLPDSGAIVVFVAPKRVRSRACSTTTRWRECSCMPALWQPIALCGTGKIACLAGALSLAGFRWQCTDSPDKIPGAVPAYAVYSPLSEPLVVLRCSQMNARAKVSPRSFHDSCTLSDADLQRCREFVQSVSARVSKGSMVVEDSSHRRISQ
jgi:hypothetical protein